MPERIGRAWFAVTALAVAVGVGLNLYVTAERTTDPVFTDTAERVANQFAYFTIQSNLIVGGVVLALLSGVYRRSTVFRTARLDSVLAISVTGIVFWVVLAPQYHYSGLSWYSNQVVHTVVPGLAVLGWFLFGPRRLISGRIIWLSLLYPLGWLIFTLVRGAIVHWYPYSFTNVDKLGYVRVTINSLVILVLMLILATVFLGFDRLLARGTRRPVTVG